MNSCAILNTEPSAVPLLDPEFSSAFLRNRAFRSSVRSSGREKKIRIALSRSDENVSVFETLVFDDANADEFDANVFHVERLVKSLLWAWGGYRVDIAGDVGLARALARSFHRKRSFDIKVMEQLYEKEFRICSCRPADFPEEKISEKHLGRNTNGFRIGFDLGGSGIKCVAMEEGKVVYEDATPWEPYFQTDISYHRSRISEVFHRVASHLPQVDAVGISCAGVIMNNRIRLSSLFRGIPQERLAKDTANFFNDFAKEWKVPVQSINDGEVSALAGSMELKTGGVLGVSFGTSLAGGYVSPAGNVTDRLNELAFVPVDFALNAPEDEWSKDIGCGVQYFSIQAISRLAKLAGISADRTKDEKAFVRTVIESLAGHDEKAERIFRTMGVEFGYTSLYYKELYPDIKAILLLGGATSGRAGEIIVEEAGKIIRKYLPKGELTLSLPGRSERRFGQAAAAATLPEIKRF